MIFAIGWASAGCGARRVPAPPPESGAVAGAMERFRTFALAPARVPPPSLDGGWVGAAGARARLVRPEEAGWNAWADAEMRLFNDRWAWVAEVAIDAPGARWVAAGTTLELNDTTTVLRAASIADEVLGDLLFWAIEQQRHGLGEDLAARTRAAGAFRAAYLRADERGLRGLIAFPAADHDGLHVVAARLTVRTVDGFGIERNWTWVFE